jgi:uncharacterized membrane protein YobD (UPF0266 family)
MKIGQILSLAGATIMGFSIIYGLIVGDFAGEGSVIFSLLWGKVTLIDIYISFFIFTAWIIYRENNFLNSLIWFILMMVLGSFTSCLYLFLAFKNANSDWQKFWFGHRYKIN